MSKYPIPFGRDLLLLERINVGGMAEVFRAKSFGVEGFERIVAIKRILPTLVQDDEFISMFIDEARIAAHLTHQNIVQIYGLGKHDGSYFISMEYIAGQDLRQILDRQKKLGELLDPTVAAFIVARVCEALDYAHCKHDPAGRPLHIIHRDVTPQNVIVSYRGDIKLCDFGIAKAAIRVSRTQVGVLKGKFAYMAPEQVLGQPVDARSDVFSLGVILYEMLTGERLFLGETDYATLEAVRDVRIPPPKDFNPTLSDDLERVLLKMLARAPDDRYPTAADAQEDLLLAVSKQDRPFHNRHLRDWMQDRYAVAIKAENNRMEGFLALRHPDIPDDPMVRSHSTIDRDPTADFPALPDEVRQQLEPPADEPEAHAPSTGSDRPGRLGHSPVSSLFGPPQVAESVVAGEASMVRPARGDTLAELEQADDDDLHERTVFDPIAPVDETETILGGDHLSDSVVAAREELRAFLKKQPQDDSPFDDVPDDALSRSASDPTQHGLFVEHATEDRTSIQETASPESVFAAEDETPLGFSPAYPQATIDEALPVISRLPSTRNDFDGPPPILGGDTRIESLEPASMMVGDGSPLRFAGGRPPNVGGSFEDGESTVAFSADEPVPVNPPARMVAPVEGPGLALGRAALLAGAIGVGVLFLALAAFLFPAREASLQVQSKPVAGADVFVDDALVGQTPVRIDGLVVGQYRVRLEARGFRPYTQTIRIEAARPHTMMVPLEATHARAPRKRTTRIRAADGGSGGAPKAQSQGGE